MSNPTGRPSLVNITGLGDKIIALRKAGLSLSEISKQIQKEENVHLSITVLSRYLRKHDKDMFADTTNPDALKNIVSTLEALVFYLDKLESISSRERRAYENCLKSAKFTIIDNCKDILRDNPVTDDKRAVNRFVIELSNHLCSDCRDVISTSTMNLEDIHKFLKDYSNTKQQYLALGQWEENKEYWEKKRDLIKQFHEI